MARHQGRHQWEIPLLLGPKEKGMKQCYKKPSEQKLLQKKGCSTGTGAIRSEDTPESYPRAEMKQKMKHFKLYLFLPISCWCLPLINPTMSQRAKETKWYMQRSDSQRMEQNKRRRAENGLVWERQLYMETNQHTGKIVSLEAGQQVCEEPLQRFNQKE